MHSPPIFQDVKLSTDLPDAYSKGRVLGPHCQCASRHFAKQADAKWKVFGKCVQLPPWSAKSFNAKRDAGEKSYYFPRFQVNKVPTPGTSRPGTFRHASGHSSRCFVPVALYTDFSRIMRGLSSARAFISSFKVELVGMLGPVGINDGMMSLQQAMFTCWNWDEFIAREPTQPEVEAFKQLHWEVLFFFMFLFYCRYREDLILTFLTRCECCF